LKKSFKNTTEKSKGEGEEIWKKVVKF
jgi:hypothetical protein